MRVPLLWKLIAVLIGVPLLDMGSIILMSHYAGGWLTFGTVVVCGVLGAVLVRREGIRTWNSLRSEMAAGRLPEAPLMDGVLLLVSGCLLMTPGPLTDILGLCLLAPPVRTALRLVARARVEKMLLGGTVHAIRRPMVTVE